MNDELFRPTYLKELCQAYGLSPSKRYGQNYLVSKAVVEKILEASDIQKDDTVIEIGPGFGVLTFALAEQAKRVVAFEIEKRLQPYWEAEQKKYPNIEIIWGNVLNEFSVLSSEFRGAYKIVANLPYQITSRALRTVLEADPKPERVVVMVQKEVAERMVAKPGDMSLLSVSVQYYGDPRIITKVSKGNFWPEPKVDSAVVQILVQNMQDTSLTESLFRIARAGFANKRKQAWKNISTALGLPADRVKSVLASVVGDEKVRAQTLSVDQWRRIARELQEN